VILALNFQYVECFKKCFACANSARSNRTENLHRSTESCTVCLLYILFTFIHNVIASLLMLWNRFFVTPRINIIVMIVINPCQCPDTKQPIIEERY
jgi:peptidoglycan biosynthesis protein MviN/MurJ (putative lipid II flippase)